VDTNFWTPNIDVSDDQIADQFRCCIGAFVAPSRETFHSAEESLTTAGSKLNFFAAASALLLHSQTETFHCVEECFDCQNEFRYFLKA
jgi:hypothetical protein